MHPKASIVMAATVGLISTVAFAGLKLPDPVVIDLDQNLAYGGLGGARNSSDDVQGIYCSVQTFGSEDTTVFCKAKDANGTQAQCHSANQGFLSAAQAISSTSDIAFEWDTTTGQCTFLSITTDSAFEPPAL